MLYVLCSQEYDDFEFHGVYQGPVGLNVSKLQKEFMSNFDCSELGTCNDPKYNGPVEPYKSQKGSCCSGSFGPQEGELVAVYTSPEYGEWSKLYTEVRTEWYKNFDSVRKSKIEEFKQKYDGKDEFEMFLSFLKKEYQFQKVESVLVNV